jgi:AraC-like DNA-binding protein
MGDVSNLALNWRSVMMMIVCLPIIVCIVILLLKPLERRASQLLAALLFASVFAVMPQIIGFSGFYRVWPGLTFFPFTTTLWIGPLIYLHAYILLCSQPLEPQDQRANSSQTLGWRKWLLLPGICQSVYYTWAYIFLGDYQNKWAFSDRFHIPFVEPIETSLSVLMLALAIFAIWQMYGKYKVFVENTESVATEFEPVWLKRIIVILLIAGIIFSLVEGLSLFFHFSYIDAFPFQVMIMLGIAWLSIEAVFRLNQPFPKMSLNFNIQSNLRAIEQQTETTPSAKSIDKSVSSRSTVLDKQIDQDELQNTERASGIKQAVLEHKWFLEPRFSLRQLAERMASNEVYVSKAINQGLGLSFNDFINKLRVEHAKILMTKSKMPVINIALDSGFNSKATFNRVFKDIEKCTPSQFKQQNGLKS